MQPRNKTMLNTIPHKKMFVTITIVLMVLLTGWWVALDPLSTDLALVDLKYIWGSFYQLIALWGGVSGLLISRAFGGYKSVVGKTIIFFSFGLLFQVLGQSVYSYYNLFAGIQAPYPSFGDVGFFGSVILYIIGACYLAEATGIKFSLKLNTNKIQAIIIPVIMLVGSYYIFLKDHEYNWSLITLLDFGYPLGQALYVSVALLVLVLSRKFLGGVMKRPVIYFLIALIVQYVSDFNFLYQASRGTWFVGGYGDFLYMFSYFLMTLSIVQISYALSNLRESRI